MHSPQTGTLCTKQYNFVAYDHKPLYISNLALDHKYPQHRTNTRRSLTPIIQNQLQIHFQNDSQTHKSATLTDLNITTKWISTIKQNAIRYTHAITNRITKPYLPAFANHHRSTSTWSNSTRLRSIANPITTNSRSRNWLRSAHESKRFASVYRPNLIRPYWPAKIRKNQSNRTVPIEPNCTTVHKWPVSNWRIWITKVQAIFIY